MTNERWSALMNGNNVDGPNLTPEEIAAGWHWCFDWDELLVGPGMMELDCCTCGKPTPSQGDAT